MSALICILMAFYMTRASSDFCYNKLPRIQKAQASALASGKRVSQPVFLTVASANLKELQKANQQRFLTGILSRTRPPSPSKEPFPPLALPAAEAELGCAVLCCLPAHLNDTSSESLVRCEPPPHPQEPRSFRLCSIGQNVLSHVLLTP